MYTLAFGIPGGPELLIFIIVILIFFGKRLPSAMYSVGKSITEFKKGVSEGAPADDENNLDDKSDHVEKNAD